MVNSLPGCQQLVGDFWCSRQTLRQGKTIFAVDAQSAQTLVIVNRRGVRLLDIQDQGIWSILPLELVEDSAPVAPRSNLVVDCQVENIVDSVVVDDVGKTDKMVMVIEDQEVGSPKKPLEE